MDFTLTTYKKLLVSLKSRSFTFQTFQDFLQKPENRSVILRHDVDKSPKNALRMAALENKMGVFSTYYFRTIPCVFKKEIICKIAELGHEIGYHYEDMAVKKGKEKDAILHFENQLEKLRTIYPVKTISMHGSPRSKHSNKDLWKHHSYKDYGILGEAHIDIKSKNVLYLSDTGRCWNWHKSLNRKSTNNRSNSCFKSTHQIIRQIDELPDKIMINIHPQRWTDNPLPWLRELVWQNAKNVVKRVVVRKGT